MAVAKTEIREEIAEVGAIIDALPRTSNGKRRGISSELRARVVRLKRLSGMSGVEFARSLGIGASILSKWSGQIPASSSRAEFKRVRVTTGPSQDSASEAADELVNVEGPMGLRFAMNEAQLVGFLRRLA